MLISPIELFRAAVITVFVGYIFMDAFKIQHHIRHHFDENHMLRTQFDWQGFWFAAAVTAPAIVLHELGHKFVALGFGMSAEFFASYTWLVLGVVLKLIGFGFIFFVPGYVSWGCPVNDMVCRQALASSPWIGSLIAFAGPAINLLLWQGSKWLLANKVKKQYEAPLYVTQQVNMFLFFFNLLPIPPFDGFGVVRGLWLTFF